MKTPHHLIKLVSGIAAMLLLTASPADAFIVNWFPAGLAFGQTARVNLLNLADGAIIINGKFLDSDGSLLGEFRGPLEPGKTTSFDLNRDTLTRAQNRVQFYVLIESPHGNSKIIRASLEVFNNADGKTTVFIGNPDIKQ